MTVRNLGKDCIADGCSNQATRRYMCVNHYRRWATTATPEQKRPETISERFWAKVDKSGECWTWIGYRRKDGYGGFRINGKNERAHRVAYSLGNGSIPQGAQIDHTCHNPSCVNPRHLRPTTNKQNAENRSGAQSNNHTSGIRGVTWFRRDQKWRVQVKHHGKNFHIGYFDSLSEAESAAIDARNEKFTHNDLDRDHRNEDVSND